MFCKVSKMFIKRKCFQECCKMFYKKKLNEYDNVARCLKKNKNRNVSRRNQDVF